MVVIAIIIILVSGSVYAFLSLDRGATVGQDAASKSPLLILSADAYANESLALEDGFEAKTGISAITSIVAGSSALAADISAGDPVSVFLSVSRSSVQAPALGSQFPGWAVSFAGDEMGLAYTRGTLQTAGGRAVIASYEAAVSKNTSAGWFQFFDNLTSGTVKVGISNPNDDPAGFRAWIVLELAGMAYSLTGTEEYFVDHLITNDGNVTGPSAAALIPALVTGQIQFLFIYKSDIVSGGLSLLQLNGQVNLGVPSENPVYSRANYTTANGIEKGSAIQLWLSVPKDTTNLGGSISFVQFTIESYQSALRTYGLVPMNPPVLYNNTGYSVPSDLLTLLNTGALVEGGAL